MKAVGTTLLVARC